MDASHGGVGDLTGDITNRSLVEVVVNETLDTVPDGKGGKEDLGKGSAVACAGGDGDDLEGFIGKIPMNFARSWAT